MKTLLLTSLLAATTLAGTALAQTVPPQTMPGGGGGRGMMRADTDGDGRVSRAEATAEADRRFGRMDANGDGKLCGDENMRGRRAMDAAAGSESSMPPPMPPAAGRGMAKQDTDGDGCISRDEFRARALKRFDRLDANRDGFIDAAEMQSTADRMRQYRQQPSPEGEPSFPAPPPPPTGRDAIQNPGQ